MKKEIVPAIIVENQKGLDAAIMRVKSHVSIIQLDIMDGKFVPTHSIDFGFKVPKTSCKIEAHLMVADPEGWMNKHTDKVDLILAPIESSKDPEKIIKLAKSKGKQIGFVLNPKTPLDKVKPYLEKVDQILIMTVNPGYYGSPFLPETLKKVKELRKLKPNLNIEVDGGIKPGTIEKAAEAGANLFVSGSYVVKADDVKKAVENLKNLI